MTDARVGYQLQEQTEIQKKLLKQLTRIADALETANEIADRSRWER